MNHTLKKRVPEPSINLEVMGFGDTPNTYECPACTRRGTLYRNPQTSDIYVKCSACGFVLIHKER